jgi:hypothetical protein
MTMVGNRLFWSESFPVPEDPEAGSSTGCTLASDFLSFLEFFHPEMSNPPAVSWKWFEKANVVRFRESICARIEIPHHLLPYVPLVCRTK